MRASCNVVSGRFMGAEIEPGTFHQQDLPQQQRRAETVPAARASAIPQMGSAHLNGQADPTVPPPTEVTNTRN